ncbi:MAG TPA: dolichyl-phosphate beta-glucosyltransferase [Vicinamibacterales bacterium]
MVVPAFNEETRIASCIERLREHLPTVVPSWEIVVADDGSSDRTGNIVSTIAAADTRVRLLSLPHKGKGSAVRQGLLEARGEWRFIADADLAMPPDNLARFFDCRDATGAALIIGSREAAGSRRVDEPRARHFIGRAFNWLVRIVAVPGITDTQCGFKLLSARAVEAICPQMSIDGFAFDVEMLALARRHGFEVREVGIVWHGNQDTRVSLGRGAAALWEVLTIADRAEPNLPDGPIERLGPLSVRSWAYLLAGVFAASIAYDLMRMPVQISDLPLRPFRIAQIKMLFDAAGGHYWLTYRGFHAALMCCCLFLFTRALRVRSMRDLCAASFALVVLTGLHTFRTIVQEAFPISHFLEIVVFVLIAVNLAQARPRLAVDSLALIVFAAATLTLESGLLVWVTAVACWVVGLRGISLRGVTLMTVFLGIYFYARFVSLSVGASAVGERGSGFLFSVLDRSQLQARFGDRLVLFYAYNVVASAMSVIFSEPRAGVFVAVRSWLDGNVTPHQAIAVASSIVTTVLIAIAGVRILRHYGTVDRSDRVLLVFIAVLVANSVLSFAYVNDEIMSVSGVLYALAAFVAVRQLLARVPTTGVMATVVAAVLLVTGTAWSVRSLALHHVAQAYAFKTRND